MSIAVANTITDSILAQAESVQLKCAANEPEALKNLRAKGVATFKEVGIPTTKNEAWKYTNIAKALKQGFEFSDCDDELQNSLLNFEIPELDSYKIVLIDGKYSSELSSGKLEDKILIGSTAKAIAHHPELVEKYIGTETDNESSFIAQNNATFTDGAFVYVAKNTQVDKPIQVINLSSAKGKQYACRNIIIAEQGAEVNTLETFFSLSDNAAFGNHLTEVFVKENAKVGYDMLQYKNLNEVQVSNVTAHQEANSVFSTTNINLGGGFIRNDLRIILDGNNCDTKLYGTYLTKENQLVDNHTLVDNQKPHCLSDELYRGVLNDNSTGVFNGKVFVRQAAQKTNAYQSNNNILLGNNATMNSKPELEIYADDVKCSHGCTTGQLDEEALFYLKARAIGEKKAKGLLLRAFTDDVVSNVKSEKFQNFITELTGEYFDNL
jgi:Fe-S cluster assembly protein SufD